MTAAEVNEAFNQRQELKERRLEEGAAQGRSNFVIIRGKVINKQNQPREPAEPRDGIFIRIRENKEIIRRTGLKHKQDIKGNTA